MSLTLTSLWGAGFQPAAGALFDAVQNILSVSFVSLAAAGHRPAPRKASTITGAVHPLSTINHPHSLDD